MSVKRTITAFATVLTVAGGLGYATASIAAEEHGEGGYHPRHVEHQKWSFSGLLGKFDKAQLKRGYTVYNQVCANCHSMNLLSYRNLLEVGGPEFTKEEVDLMIAPLLQEISELKSQLGKG